MKRITLQEISVFVLVLLPLVFAIIQGNTILSLAIACWLPLTLFIIRIELWWMVTLAVSSSGLYLGFISEALSLYNVMALVFGMVVLSQMAIRKGGAVGALPWPHRFGLGLLIITFFLAYYRGIGIMALDSAIWGGMKYVILWSSVTFCLCTYYFRPRPATVRRGILLMLVLGAVPFAIRFINETTDGLLVFLSFLFYGAGEISGVEFGIQRWEGVHGSANSVILLALVLLGVHKRRLIVPAMLALLGFIILGLSGYRSMMIVVVLTVFFYFVFRRKPLSLNRKTLVVSGSILAFILMFLFARQLPFGFQRMMAWIPFLDLLIEAKISARTTLEWRWEMWLKLLPIVPDYLLIGRGLGFDHISAYSVMTLDPGVRHPFFIATHQYHNGPLYLLIDYGLVGLICGLGFMITSIVRHWRIAKNIAWTDPFFQNAHTVFLASFMAHFILYWGIFGDLETIVTMLKGLAVLEIVYHVGNAQSPVFRV